MEKNNHWLEPLKKFARTSDLSKAFLALDLDGTALLEDHGKVFISSSVEKGVKAIHDLKIPVVLNTSFNLHGEPIVYRARDAMDVFVRSGLQHMALGNWWVEKPA